MPQTSRKKRPFERSIEFRDARLIVIATEGEKTEPSYFGIFRSSRLKVKVIPCERGESAPAAVLQRMQDFREQFDLDNDDELWLVIDRDRWTDVMLSEVAQQCVASNVNLALSNPSFEVWLSLHYIDSLPEEMDSRSATELFQRLHSGYSKSKLNAEPLKPLVQTAISNARSIDSNPRDRWPNKPGSRVYLLAETIIASGL